jgi:hypothetical protein
LRAWRQVELAKHRKSGLEVVDPSSSNALAPADDAGEEDGHADDCPQDRNGNLGLLLELLERRLPTDPTLEEVDQQPSWRATRSRLA